MEKKKLSSYQKMKQKYEAKIEELTTDVTVLVENKNFEKVTNTKLKWQTILQIQEVVWCGAYEYGGDKGIGNHLAAIVIDPQNGIIDASKPIIITTAST